MGKRKYLIIFCTLLIYLVFCGQILGDKDESLAYPTLYGKDLPKYPKAKLISTGRQTTSLRDGLKLKLVSSDPVLTIVKYYKEGLKKAGWTFPRERPYQNPKIYIGKFTKGDLYYVLSVTRINPEKDESTIEITYAKD